VAQLVKIILEAGDLEYRIMIAATVSDPTPLQFLLQAQAKLKKHNSASL